MDERARQRFPKWNREEGRAKYEWGSMEIRRYFHSPTAPSELVNEMRAARIVEHARPRYSWD